MRFSILALTLTFAALASATKKQDALQARAVGLSENALFAREEALYAREAALYAREEDEDEEDEEEEDDEDEDEDEDGDDDGEVSHGHSKHHGNHKHHNHAISARGNVIAGLKKKPPPKHCITCGAECPKGSNWCNGSVPGAKVAHAGAKMMCQ